MHTHTRAGFYIYIYIHIHVLADVDICMRMCVYIYRHDLGLKNQHVKVNFNLVGCFFEGLIWHRTALAPFKWKGSKVHT